MSSFNSHNKPTSTTPTQQIGKLCLQGVGDRPNHRAGQGACPRLGPGSLFSREQWKGVSLSHSNSTDDMEEENTGERKCRRSGPGMFKLSQTPASHQHFCQTFPHGSAYTHFRQTFPHGSAYTSWNIRSDPQSQLSVVPWPPLASLRGFLEEGIPETVAGPRFYASVSL